MPISTPLHPSLWTSFDDFVGHKRRCELSSSGVPHIAFMPAIVRFLGYDPTPEPTTTADRMRSYRQRLGLSIKEAAHRARVDESSWGTWERTGLIPWKRYQMLLGEFLAQQLRARSSPDDLVP